MMVTPFENCSVARMLSAARPVANESARTDVFPRRIERVEVVKVRERAEELLRAAHLVSNHKAALARAFNLENLDHGSIPLLDIPHHTLVDLERVLAGFLQEDGV